MVLNNVWDISLMMVAKVLVTFLSCTLVGRVNDLLSRVKLVFADFNNEVCREVEV